MKAVIYLRKSTDDGKRQKASIEDQRKWALEYVEKLEDCEVVQIFEEKKSAKEPGRPMFNEMMGLIYTRKADTILAWDIDRLSRNEVDEGTLKWAIRQGNIKSVHTHNSIYTEHELLTMGIFLSLGAEEIAKMRQRVMRRMGAMIGEGKVPYMAPYGYKNINGTVEIIEDEAIILKRIYSMRVEGLSYKQIADTLNEEKIPTRGRGRISDKGVWTTGAISHIIVNDFYIGITRFAGQVGVGIYDKIISRDLFDEANKENRANIGYKMHDFFFKGLVYSEEGKPLKASKIKGKFNYYHNTGWKIKISEKDILKKCEEVVKLWVIPEEFLPKIEKLIREDIIKEGKAILEEKKYWEKKLSEISISENNILKLYEKGKIDEDTYDMRAKEHKKERYNIGKKIECLTGFDDAIIEKFNKTVELVRNLYQTYKNASDYQKGCILKNALVELVVNEKKELIIKEKEPFYWLSFLNNCMWQPHFEECRTPLMRLCMYLYKNNIEDVIRKMNL